MGMSDESQAAGGMARHIKCGNGWLMANHSITPVASITSVGISQARPKTVSIACGTSTTTLDCETDERARELLVAIWDALQAGTP
jgi:hypothetical protein